MANKIVLPKIKFIETKDIDDCLDERELMNCQFDNIEVKRDICDLSLDSCIFNNVDFSNIKLQNNDLVDVIFDNCDLSNQSFDNHYLCRVVFKNCKLTGASFINCMLKEINFEDCLANYVSFSGSKFNNVLIEKSSIEEGNFSLAEFKKICFDDVNLHRSEFLQVNLNGVDVSKCDISNCLFDHNSLRGLIVDQFQCAQIVGSFGVVVKE